MAISVTSRAICAPKTEMFAGPEAQMSERPPLDVEGVRIRKFALVAVGRAEGERDLVTGANRLTVQCHIALRRALEALRRRIEAKRFLDRRREPDQQPVAAVRRDSRGD